MKLETQVSNKELSKKLKSLGVKQESLWFYNSKTMKLQRGFTSHTDIEGFCRWSISAFTVAELGEMLKGRTSMPYYIKGKWYYSNENANLPDCITFSEDTEANARAKLLIHLIEHKLMEAI